jgi:hypothetical protein
MTKLSVFSDFSHSSMSSQEMKAEKFREMKRKCIKEECRNTG